MENEPKPQHGEFVSSCSDAALDRAAAMAAEIQAAAEAARDMFWALAEAGQWEQSEQVALLYRWLIVVLNCKRRADQAQAAGREAGV